MRLWIIVCLGLLLPASFLACGGGTTPTSCGDKDISYKTCVQPIFVKSCGGSGCHGASNPSQGLTLTENGVANTVGKAAKQDATKMQVKAGSPDESWLLIKIKANPPVGQQMPLGGTALTAAEIKLVETWIKEGAKDN